MKRIVLGWMLAMCCALAWALPSTQDVQQAVSRGDYAQAETMMQEVVAAKSGSANAHYVYAEILARNGKFTLASDEARRASEIDPQTRFTDPAKFRAFQQLLEREQQPQARTPVSRGADSRPAVAAPAPVRSGQMPGIPGWVWVAGLAVVGYGAWKLMSRNSARSNAAGPGYTAAMAGGPGAGGAMVPGNMAGNPAYGPGPGGYAPGGYAPGMQGPGMGGGMLRTGMAVAGGLAAGALVNEMMHRGDGQSSHAADGAAAGAGAGAGSGLFDSVQPDTASAELETRAVDFGNDGWDSGSADAGGSSDDGGWS